MSLTTGYRNFDHSGGLRTYAAEGAIIITSAGNKAYYERIWKAPRRLDPDRLAQAPKKAAFIEVKARRDGLNVWSRTSYSLRPTPPTNP